MPAWNLRQMREDAALVLAVLAIAALAPCALASNGPGPKCGLTDYAKGLEKASWPDARAASASGGLHLRSGSSFQIVPPSRSVINFSRQQSFSFEFWIRFASFPFFPGSFVLFRNSEFALGCIYENDDHGHEVHFGLSVGDGSMRWAHDITTHMWDWIHVAGTYDMDTDGSDGNLCLYYGRGQEVNARAWAARPMTNPPGDLAATFEVPSTPGFSIFIDEIKLWQGSGLLYNEIESYMDRPLDMQHPRIDNLAAYYRFDNVGGRFMVEDLAGCETRPNLTGNAAVSAAAGYLMNDERITLAGIICLATILPGVPLALVACIAVCCASSSGSGSGSTPPPPPLGQIAIEPPAPKAEEPPSSYVTYDASKNAYTVVKPTPPAPAPPAPALIAPAPAPAPASLAGGASTALPYGSSSAAPPGRGHRTTRADEWKELKDQYIRTLHGAPRMLRWTVILNRAETPTQPCTRCNEFHYMDDWIECLKHPDRPKWEARLRELAQRPQAPSPAHAPPATPPDSSRRLYAQILALAPDVRAALRSLLDAAASADARREAAAAAPGPPPPPPPAGPPVQMRAAGDRDESRFVL